MQLPRKYANANTPKKREWNNMVDALRAVQPAQGAGTFLTRTPHGTIHGAMFRRSSAGSPAEASGGVERFRIKSVHADYLTCRTWDGTTEGGTDVLIAKPLKLRHVASEVIEGTTISYTYGSRTNNLDGDRDATDGTTTIVEIVMPVYIVNAPAGTYDEILACQPVRGTGVSVSGTPLVWEDLNVDGRMWGQVT